MFGDPVENPMGWENGTIRDIVTEVKYGTSKPADEGGQYPYLRMNNITYEGQLDVSNLKYIDVPEREIEKYIVRKGDVLFNRTNSKELVGKTCVFDLDEPMIIAGYIIRVRTNNRAVPAYISDITRPVKEHLPNYKEIEKRLQDTIYEQFLGSPLTEEEITHVDQIDRDMLVCEFNALMEKKVFDFVPDIKSNPRFDFCEFAEVEKEFSDLYRRLVKYF
jgi:hypothetical protein